MWQTILNTIGTAALAALVAVGVAAIKAFGDAGVALIQKKKDAVVAKIGADTYNHRLTVAREMWGAVDEDIRITPTLEKTIANKQALFAQKIKQAIPGITDDEIEQLRQAVAGEVNKGREAIVGQTQDEQGNGLVAGDKATVLADSIKQEAAQAAPVAQPQNTNGAV
jgi:hypothetical protein